MYDLENILNALERNRATGNTTKIASLDGVTVVVANHHSSRLFRDMNSCAATVTLAGLSNNFMAPDHKLPLVFDNHAIYSLLDYASKQIRELKEKTYVLEDNLDYEKRSKREIIIQSRMYQDMYVATLDEKRRLKEELDKLLSKQED